MKNFFKNSFVAFGSSVICFLVAEIFLRLISPVERTYPLVFNTENPNVWLECYDGRFQSIPDWDLRKDNLPYQSITYSNDVDGYRERRKVPLDEVYKAIEMRANDQDFRERPFEAIEKEAQVTLVVGDSFCFGQGVRVQDRFSSLLEQELGFPNRFVNLCNPGNNIEETYNKLTTYLDSFPNAKRVLYAYTLNGPVWDKELGNPGDLMNDFMHYRERNWHLKSYFLRWLFRRFENQRVTRATEEWYHKIHDNHSGWPKTKNLLLEMNQMAKSKGIEFVFVVFPLFHELKNYPFHDIHQKLQVFCLENGIQYLDLLKIFEAQDEEKLWVHPTDFHPNHMAHKKVADFLASTLSW